MKGLFSSISAVFAALMACTCCVGPLMALAGMLGVSASQLIWLASIKNYLMAFSLVLVAFNLYRAYFPKKEESCCEINPENQEAVLSQKEQQALSFFQSKKFLWAVFILTLLIISYPYILNA